MTDFQPYLAGCDQALAEAELLITSLTEGPGQIDEDLTALRQRIATMRLEVERLRGMRRAPIPKRIQPERINFNGLDSPWATARQP